MGLFCLDHGIINGNFLLPYFISRPIYTVYTVYIYLYDYGIKAALVAVQEARQVSSG